MIKMALNLPLQLSQLLHTVHWVSWCVITRAGDSMALVSAVHFDCIILLLV